LARKEYLPLLFLFCLGLTGPQLYSQDREGLVTGLEMRGYRRTKPHIARQPLEAFIGREAASLDMLEVQGVILGMGVFDLVSEELVPAAEGYTLVVEVAEKWSIFPVPMLMASSGELSFGLFFLDTNAFGIRDTMVAGGLFSSSGWNGIAMYNHSPMRAGLPGLSGSVTYGRRQREDLDKYETVHRRYSTSHLGLSFGLRYPFTRALSGSFSLSYRDIALIENEEPLLEPQEGARLLRFSPGLGLRRSSWDGYFLSEQSLSFSYTYNLALEGSSYQDFYIRGNIEQPLLPGLRLIARSGGVYKTGTEADGALLFEEGPSRSGVDILPRRFSAHQYVGFSAGLEQYLYRFSMGTLSLQASWQLVLSEGPLSGRQLDHGPAGALRFYLARLALPALGGGLAYNMNSGLFQFSLDFGMEL